MRNYTKESSLKIPLSAFSVSLFLDHLARTLTGLLKRLLERVFTHVLLGEAFQNLFLQRFLSRNASVVHHCRLSHRYLHLQVLHRPYLGLHVQFVVLIPGREVIANLSEQAWLFRG